jgi:hypothetical protein
VSKLIALRTRLGPAHRFGSEQAVAQWGVSLDGIEKQLLPSGFAQRFNETWPRHNLGYGAIFVPDGTRCERVVDNMYSTARNMLPRSGGHVIRRLTSMLSPGNGETLVPSCGIPTRPSSDRHCLHVFPSVAAETLCAALQHF